MKIVVDTYAWIELLIGSQKGQKVKELIENAEEVFTPSTVLAEAARKFLREGTDEQTINIWLEIITTSSVITQIDSATALESAKCQLELATKSKNLQTKHPQLIRRHYTCHGQNLPMQNYHRRRTFQKPARNHLDRLTRLR